MEQIIEKLDREEKGNGSGERGPPLAAAQWAVVGSGGDARRHEIVSATIT